MSKQYRLVIFDWEGTISDTFGPVLHAVRDEAQQLNLGEIDEKLARHAIEHGLAAAIKKLFPLLTSHEYQLLINAIQQSLLLRHNHIYLMPGVKDIIHSLHQAHINLAIASNKHEKSLQKALKSTALDEFFTFTRTAGQTNPKPCPQMLQEILQHFTIPVQDAVMIGDSVIDMEMASEIKMDAIGIDFYGQQTSHLLAAGAQVVFDDYSLLADYLQLPNHQEERFT